MAYLKKLFPVLLLVSSLATSAAHAQDDDTQAASAAQLEVRLSAMEEEIRNLRGKVEETEFQNRKLSETLEKMQRDTDFRLGELEHNPAAAAANGPVDEAASPGVKKVEIIHERKPLNANMEASVTTAKAAEPAEGTSAGNGLLQMPDKNADDNTASPRDLYNHAFRLVNQAQYEDAAASFENFTKKYPTDPLIGNAYYWLGETYYIRRDYVNAADNFRQGFEALPAGPKAADNLLKLAMSLDALKRDKEACIVLQQVLTKFKASSTSVTQKALQEQTRIGCQ